MKKGILAERLDLSEITSPEMLFIFLDKFSAELTSFVNKFIDSLPEKESIALNSLFKNKDEYSELIFKDIIDRFFDENKDIEKRIIEEIKIGL